jgi:2-oxoglutarate ferredoxin oxidoreductase subunit beta
MQAGFVARGFSGMQEQLVALIQEALDFPGFSLVDILQPCVSFNHVNTLQWYKQRCTPLEEDYDPTDWEQAMVKSLAWGDSIPTGVIFKNEAATPFAEHFSVLSGGPLMHQTRDMSIVSDIMESYA